MEVKELMCEDYVKGMLNLLSIDSVEDWNNCGTHKNGVEVFYKELSKNDIKFKHEGRVYKGVGKLECDLGKIIEFLEIFENRKKWDKSNKSYDR